MKTVNQSTNSYSVEARVVTHAYSNRFNFSRAMMTITKCFPKKKIKQ